MLVNDIADQLADFRHELSATSSNPVRIEELSDPGKMVRPVERAQELETFSNHALDFSYFWVILRPVLVSLPEDAAHDPVQCSQLEVAAETNLSGGNLLALDGPQHGGTVSLPAQLVRGDSPRREEVGSGDSAE